MFKKLTLRNRIFVITSLLILFTFGLIWTFVRPRYRDAIIKERTTIVSQLQEYSLKRTDYTIQNWLNAINILAEDIIKNPIEIESIITRAINYTPGLIRITINENGSKESIDFKRTIYNKINFPATVNSWHTSKIDNRINIAWLPDSTQTVDFFISQRIIQIANNVFTLNMYFDAKKLTKELTEIPLGGKYVANIVSDVGENIIPNNDFDFPKYLVGDASFSSESIVSLGGKNWFIMSSGFSSIPYWHLIAVEDSYILQPVNRLIFFSLFTSLGILALMVFFSWYVSDKINKPIEKILDDIHYISRLDFEHKIKEVDLPEFQIMQNTLEDIRLKLHRYQKINVEKIILEEWKNRYMMTYSEDLIGILDNEGKFSFVNNNFTEFIESFKLNPKEIKLEDLLKQEKINIIKSNQTVHYPEPYTIQIGQAEMEHTISQGKTHYYDYQYVAIEDEENKPQGALVILHDKTEDRLLDIERNNMINIIVHELKNPITGVVGLSKLMLDNPSLEIMEQQELLQEVFMSGERMNTLVNRFLDVQRLEYGKINVEFFPIDILYVATDVRSVSNAHLSEKKLKLQITHHGSNFTILGNKELVFDAVQNLVSNAIKYGNENRTIQMDVLETPTSVELSVTDYGFGIEIEDQKKIFDKFYRIRSKTHSAQKGSGLGLAYVKEIMNKHHGDIKLESNEKIGSKFTLIFPKNTPAK